MSEPIRNRFRAVFPFRNGSRIDAEQFCEHRNGVTESDTLAANFVVVHGDGHNRSNGDARQFTLKRNNKSKVDLSLVEVVACIVVAKAAVVEVIAR